MRRIVFGRSDAFIAASRGGIRLFRSYGADFNKCFLSPLCADNAAFAKILLLDDRRFDVIFCSRMVEGKNPLFALDVALEASRRLGRPLHMLFVGSGELDERLKAQAEKRRDDVACAFHGFARQEDLPSLYGSARLFLFPTAADVWGVVANEACAAGLPVIVSPHAGVAGELVVDAQNGFVVSLDVNTWAERVCQILSDAALWKRLSAKSLKLVEDYTYETAAHGILQACEEATPRRGKRMPQSSALGSRLR